MSIAKILKENKSTAFSFEILPPLKGNSINGVFSTIDKLVDFNPSYINITTHRNEVAYHETESGVFRKVVERRRPGTVAIASAINHRYGIKTVPHIICSGYTKEEIEYELIDLSFMGITDLLVLRGDKAKHDPRFIATKEGHEFAVQLQQQINTFNKGEFLDGSTMNITTPFSYGTAGYPEKHDEAMNADTDLIFLKDKVDNGAEYIVTQMFFDNKKYFEFVEKCRNAGINVPIIPGLKPIAVLNHKSMLPKTFHIDFPDDLAKELIKCQTNDEAKALGIEWCIYQAKELKAHNVPSIHFYSINAVNSIVEVAKAIY